MPRVRSHREEDAAGRAGEKRPGKKQRAVVSDAAVDLFTEVLAETLLALVAEGERKITGTAERGGLSRSAVSLAVHGLTSPTAETLLRMALAQDTWPDQVLQVACAQWRRQLAGFRVST